MIEEAVFRDLVDNDVLLVIQLTRYGCIRVDNDARLNIVFVVLTRSDRNPDRQLRGSAFVRFKLWRACTDGLW